MDTTGLYTYKDDGTNTLALRASDGSMVANGGSWYAGAIGAATIYARATPGVNGAPAKSSGANVVMDTTGLYAYNTSSTTTFTLTADTGTVNIVSNGLDGLQLDGANDKITFFKSGVEKAYIKSYTGDSNGGLSLSHVGGAYCFINNQKVSISAGPDAGSSLIVGYDATLNALNKTVISAGNNSIIVSSTAISIGQGIRAEGDSVVGPDPVYSTAIKDKTTTLTGNMYISSSTGLIYRGLSAASSRNIKNGITDLSIELDPKKLLDIPVRQFKYNTDVLTDTDDSRYDTFIPGFIADEVAAAYPIAADYEDGKPIGWNYVYIIPPMLKLIQDQQKTIDELVTRVQNLEGVNK
jgi:hypothetical protein